MVLIFIILDTCLILNINHLFGHIEKIEGSSDRYLVVNINFKRITNVFDKIWRFIEQRITSNGIWKFVENEIIFNNANNKIKEYNKLRSTSNLDLPLDTLIEFRALTLTINCVIEKDSKYCLEIYLDEGLYVNDDYLKEYINNGSKIIKN